MRALITARIHDRYRTASLSAIWARLPMLRRRAQITADLQLLPSPMRVRLQRQALADRSTKPPAITARSTSHGFMRPTQSGRDEIRRSCCRLQGLWPASMRVSTMHAESSKLQQARKLELQVRWLLLWQ